VPRRGRLKLREWADHDRVSPTPQDAGVCGGWGRFVASVCMDCLLQACQLGQLGSFRGLAFEAPLAFPLGRLPPNRSTSNVLPEQVLERVNGSFFHRLAGNKSFIAAVRNRGTHTGPRHGIGPPIKLCQRHQIPSLGPCASNAHRKLCWPSATWP